MAEDDYDKWSNNIPSPRPDCHPRTVFVKMNICAIPSSNVRSKGKVDARETNG